MAVIRDIDSQQESAAVAEILLQLKKREDQRQRLWWLLGIAILALFASILVMVLM